MLLIAPDMKQVKVLLDYAEGVLESTPMLKQLIDGRTKDTLTLTTGICLEVRSASFRRIRGITCVAVLADECAFWLSDESANPDTEILNAARAGVGNGPTAVPLPAALPLFAGLGLMGWMTRRRRKQTALTLPN